MAYTQVDAASSSDIDIAAPGFSALDLVALTSGTSRILLTGQSTASQNGVWIFNGSTNPLSRPARTGDAYRSGSTLDNGTIVWVRDGAALGGTAWGVDPAAVVVVDTTAHALKRVSLPPVQARVATTTDIDLTATFTNIDGISLTGIGAPGSDLVLVKQQTSAPTNGLYWANTGGAMVRCSEPLTRGRVVLVSEGDRCAHSRYELSTKGPIRVGLTALQFWPQGFVFVLNVRDFGAQGDGTTDDTDAIQAALVEANKMAVTITVPGTTGYYTTPEVFFPSGTYKVSTIYLFAFTRMRGDYLSVLAGSDSRAAVVEAAGQYTIIEGLTITGGRWNIRTFGYVPQGVDKPFGGGFFTGSPSNGGLGLTVQNANLRGSKGPSIYIDDTGRFGSLTAGSSGGTDTITISEVPSFVAKGAQLLVETATGTYVKEYVTVSSVNVGTGVVTLASNLAHSFSEGDFVGYAPNDRGSACQVLVENCELENYSTFWGATNSVIFRDSYLQFYFNVVGSITAPAAAGQPNIVVSSVDNVQVGDMLSFGGASVNTNPDGFNIEYKKIARIDAVTKTITFEDDLQYAHNQTTPMLQEVVMHAPETDDEFGFVLPVFGNSNGQLCLDGVAGAPNSYFYSHQLCWLQGSGDFRILNTRLGGEATMPFIRTTLTNIYNRHLSTHDLGENNNILFDKLALSSCARDNWMEFFDVIPQRISIVNEMGNATEDPNAYLSLEPLTFQIWLHEGIDLTEFVTGNVLYPQHDIRLRGENNVALKYRQSSLQDRCFPGSGVDVTNWFRQWAVANNYNGPQLSNQVGVPRGTPKMNLWFAGLYDAYQACTFPSLSNMHLDTTHFDTDTGYRLTKMVADKDGYLSPTDSNLDPDDPTGFSCYLNYPALEWGTSLPAGEYCFSWYFKSKRNIVAYTWATAAYGVGGGQRFPFMSTAGEYRRGWFPFYYDGVHRITFSLATENTLKVGEEIMCGLLMINEGTEPASYVFPVDRTTYPTTNKTVENKVLSTYYGESTSPPSSGTYQAGDMYVVYPPQSGTVNVWLRTADSNTWAPAVTQTTTPTLSIGTSPATTGLLRFSQSTAAICARNGANTADLRILFQDTSDNFALFDNTQSSTTIYAGGNFHLISASNYDWNYSSDRVIHSGGGQLYYMADQASNIQFMVNQRTTDAPPCTLSLQSGSAMTGGSTNKNGADLKLFPGLAASGGINGYIDFENSQTTTTAPGAGGGGALPATPTGYLSIKINGAVRQIPYY